jgi:hypothetical protein
VAVTVLRVCAQFQTSITVPAVVISGVRRFLTVLVLHTFRTVVKRGNRDIGLTTLRGGRPRTRTEFTTGEKISCLKHLARQISIQYVRFVACLDVK